MKKLMIAAAMVCAAAMSQAASTDWTVYMDATLGSALYAAGSGDGDEFYGTPIGGTMYIFNADNIGQEAVYNAIMASGAPATTLAELAAANGFATGITVGSNGGIVGGTALLTGGPTEGGSYFAVITATDGNYFFDDAVDGSYNELTGGNIYIEPQAWSGDPSYDFTSFDSWQDSTGWYSTVPEPTSGLLLLLGVAGLALRRRRA